MSVTLDISERRLRLGIFKLAVSLVFIFCLLATGFAFLAGRGQGIAIQLLLVCVAFTFLTNGVLAVLKIIDWFEGRGRRHG